MLSGSSIWVNIDVKWVWHAHQYFMRLLQIILIVGMKSASTGARFIQPHWMSTHGQVQEKYFGCICLVKNNEKQITGKTKERTYLSIVNIQRQNARLVGFVKGKTIQLGISRHSIHRGQCCGYLGGKRKWKIINFHLAGRSGSKRSAHITPTYISLKKGVMQYQKRIEGNY